jgi:hypothetical protein
MTGQHDPFADVFGSVRGSAERRVDDAPAQPSDLDAEALERLRQRDVEPDRMWDFAWELAGDIAHDPEPARHLSNDGEPFLRYCAKAPCQLVVEPEARRCSCGSAGRSAERCRPWCGSCALSTTPHRRRRRCITTGTSR